MSEWLAMERGIWERREEAAGSSSDSSRRSNAARVALA